MNGKTVLYQGRQVPKENFRAFVYGIDNATKLVNSWKEYLDACASGNWFSSNEDVPAEKPKPVKKVGK